MTTLLRWAAVPLTALMGLYIAMAITFGLRGVLTAACPEEVMISGLCGANWFWAAENVLVCIGAALAATLLVALPTLIAPSHKVTVACSLFFTGSVVALVAGVQTSDYGPIASAIFAGIATTAVLLRSRRRRAELPVEPSR